MSVANPFSTVDISIAREFRDRMDDLQSPGDKQKPFGRQIDVWWAGMCLGLRDGHRTPLPADTVKFATGVIFDSDPWRIAHLQLIALADGGADALHKPGWSTRVVTMASEYANGGLAWLFDTVSGTPNPTLAIYRRLDELLD